MAANCIDINKALVDRCRNGDGKAQYELYHLYSRQMYNICMRIVNNVADAEDVLQESFLEAFKRINEFRGDSTFGAWLKKIVINRAINSIKKYKPLLLEHNPEADNLQYEETGNGTEDIEYEVKRVYSALSELPEGYRLVLNLYLLEGYDHAEIAQILNITESTSKSQYSRAKAKLKERLKEKYYAG